MTAKRGRSPGTSSPRAKSVKSENTPNIKAEPEEVSMKADLKKEERPVLKKEEPLATKTDAEPATTPLKKDAKKTPTRSTRQKPSKEEVKAEPVEPKNDEKTKETEDEEEEQVDRNDSDSDWSPSLEDAFSTDGLKKAAKGKKVPQKTPPPLKSPPPTPKTKEVASPGRVQKKQKSPQPKSTLPITETASTSEPNAPPTVTIPPFPANITFSTLRDQMNEVFDYINDIMKLSDGKVVAPLRQTTGTVPGRLGRRDMPINARGRRGSFVGRSAGGRFPARRPGNFAARGRGLGGSRTIMPGGAPMPNPNEPVALSPIGSKVGLPYTGKPVAPEQISPGVFVLKTGTARAPILFVLAQNPDDNNGGFDFSLLHRIISNAGGMVVANVDGLPVGRLNLNVAPTLSFCVASSPNQSPEYLFGIAYGARCIYPTWVLECASSGRILDHKDYLLPAGKDVYGSRILQHRRRMIFGGRKVVLACGSLLTSTRFAKVLAATGATTHCIMDGISQLEESDTAKIKEASYIVVDSLNPPSSVAAIVSAAQASNKPLVTVEWLSQSVMFGQVIEPNCHASFTWSPATPSVPPTSAKPETVSVPVKREPGL